KCIRTAPGASHVFRTTYTMFFLASHGLRETQKPRTSRLAEALHEMGLIALLRPIRIPNGPNRLLIAQPIRYDRTRHICEVPASAIQRRAHRAAAGHLQMAVGVRLGHPVPGIA